MRSTSFEPVKLAVFAEYRHGARRAARAGLRVAKLEAAAWRTANQRAKFHACGAARLEIANGKDAGKRVTRNSPLAQRRKVRAKFTEGTGLSIETQTLLELYLAARAALLCSQTADLAYCPQVRPSQKLANRAASSELHHSTREPVFADMEKAARAQDRAYRRARETWQDREPVAGQAQPHCAEFLSGESLPPRAIVARGLWRARKAVRAYWAASKSPFRFKGQKDDMRALRDLAADILRGVEGLNRWRDDASRAQRLHRLSGRVSDGIAALLPVAVERESVAVYPPRYTPRTFDLPSGRAENWLADFLAGQFPAASRILNRADASDLASLAEWRPGIA